MQDIGILKSQKLEEYILKTFCYPREHEQLKQLREATVDKYQYWSIMNVPVDEALFLSMLLKVTNAKKIIEIGVFTGYSLLNAALAVPNDALIVAIDPDREAYETGLPYIRKAGVESKIKFIQSDAQTILKDLLAKNEQGSFDFVFVDADKENYIVYHELVLKLVKIGGLICYDNTLWKGLVALSEDNDNDNDNESFLKRGSKIFRAFNDFIAGDARVEVSLVSIGDGLTICRRLE